MRPTVALVLAALGTACAPEPAPPVVSPDEPVVEVPTFTCDPAAAPVQTPLRRLSRQEVQYTVRDLAAGLPEPVADQVLDAIREPLASLPADSEAHARLDQVVSQEHVEAWYAVGEAFAEGVSASPDALRAVLGACATDRDSSNDVACIEAFIEDFGARVARRPLQEAERDFLMQRVYQADRVQADAVADLVSVLLSGPYAVYHLEDAGTPVAGRPDLVQLSAYELASRLSYHFWLGPPDQELLAAAADGSLLTDAGYQAQLDRVAADPRSRRSTRSVFDGWLHVSELPSLDGLVDDPRYQAFAGEDLPSPGLRERMLDDAFGLVHYELERGGSLDDVLTSTAITTRDQDVAALYDSYAWDGIGEPDQDPERPGLLTRPALVASATHLTQPIHKGVRIRRRVLCDTVGAPPADLGELPTIDETATRRTQTEQLTEREGTSCRSCHVSTNPLGYATENFDALGRFRSEELIFSESGEVVATHPVDTSGVYAVHAADTEVSSGPAELAARLVESGKPHACLARHVLRHATARLEDDIADGCWLESIRADLIGGTPLNEALKRVAARPEFRLKAVEAP